MPSPTPEHQSIAGILFASVFGYLRHERGGWALAGSEFALGEDDRPRPDVGILPTERWRRVDRRKSPIPLAPDIAAEVISPGERAIDSHRKIWTYLGAGVEEVWQVWPENRQIFVYREPKSVTVLDIGDRLTTPLLPDWGMDLRDLFEF